MARSTSEDEDDISLASTTWTEDRSNYSPRDFNVERILAEHEEAGQLKYLIKWENYNVDRASFEPADEIPDFHVQRWEEKKVRIENGIDTALDVAAWVDNVARIKQEKNDRRQRRKAKRARIAARANIQWPRKAIPEPSSRDSDDEPLIVGRRQGLGATLPTTSNDASRNEKVPAKETYSKPKVTTTVPTKAPSKIFANWTNPRERKKRRGSESANPENIMTKEGRTRRFNTLAEQHRIRNAGANERPPQPGYEKHHQFDPETGDYRRISEPHIDTPSHLSGGMAQVARQSSGSVTAAEATLPRRVTLDTALDQSPPRESVAQQPQRAVSSLQTNIPEVTPEPVERMNLTDPERKVPLTCPSWKSDGNCRDGEDCPFLHRDSAYVASYNLQAEARRWSPKFGRPLVSAPLTCGYWYMNGFCKLSVDGCMFAHWNTGKLTGFGGRPPQAIPWERDGAISELALKQIKTCFFWAIGKCIKPAEECQFAHRLLDQIAHPPAGWPGEGA